MAWWGRQFCLPAAFPGGLPQTRPHNPGGPQVTFPYLAHVPYIVAFLLFTALLLALALARPTLRQREQPEPPQAKRRAAGIP